MNSKRIISVLLSIAILITATFVCFATTSNDAALDNELGYNSKELKSVERFDKTFLKNQAKVSAIYDKLHQSFKKDGTPDADDYPDYYGGAFISNDGKLNIYVKDNTPSNIQDLKKRAGTDEFDIKPCKYSFKMLNKIMDTLNSHKLNNPKSSVCANFNAYEILDDQNIVVVHLDEYNQEQIESFKKEILDSTAIEFRTAVGKIKDQADVNAGALIGNGLGSASVGYRARLNGVDGFVTAGHFALYLDNIYKDGNIIAECTKSQNSGSVDAAFCKITNLSYIPTNIIDGTSSTLSTTINEPSVGTVIYKAGSGSGITSGKILSTNASAYNQDGVLFTNLTSADFYSTAGDSGGVVYSYLNSIRYTLGINKGSSDSGTSYFTKAYQINVALGTSRY